MKPMPVLSCSTVRVSSNLQVSRTKLVLRGEGCNGPTLMIILITLNYPNDKLIKLGPDISIRHFLILIQHFLYMYLYHCRLNR